MTTDRRAFLTQAASAGLAVPLLATQDLVGPPAPPPSPRVNRIAVSTYSFWQFRNRNLRSIETCIDLAAEMGFDGVEILHRQMERETNDYLQAIKRRAFLNGLDLCGFSIHQGFLSPDRDVRQRN